jgi:hypothetical protein
MQSEKTDLDPIEVLSTNKNKNEKKNIKKKGNDEDTCWVKYSLILILYFYRSVIFSTKTKLFGCLFFPKK